MNREPSPEAQQTLTEHLRDLRVRIIRSLVGILIAAAVCYHYVETILIYVRMPIEHYLQSGGLVFTAPGDKFLSYLKVAIFSGVLVATPWWFYQLWRFVAPGLYSKERRYAMG